MSHPDQTKVAGPPDTLPSREIHVAGKRAGVAPVAAVELRVASRSMIQSKSIDKTNLLSTEPVC